MSKKRDIKNALTAEEEFFVNEKMNGGHENRYSNIPHMGYNNILNYKINLKCKNKKQKELCGLVEEKEMVFCSGTFGTGKSYCINAMALKLLKNKECGFDNILLIVPTCEAGNMSLGYLKGTLEEKMSVYVDAEMDTMLKVLKNSGNTNAKDILDKLRKSEAIQAEPVNFVRGKSWDNKLVLVSEAENFNKQELFLIISRLGNNSKMIISGDPQQMDRKDIMRNGEKCGLEYAVKQLKDIDEIGIIEFDKEDIVRNKLVSKIYDVW